MSFKGPLKLKAVTYIRYIFVYTFSWAFIFNFQIAFSRKTNERVYKLILRLRIKHFWVIKRNQIKGLIGSLLPVNEVKGL